MSEVPDNKYERLTEEGVRAYEGRNYKVAIDTLLKVTDKQPQNWLAKLYLALSYSRCGDQLMSRPLLRYLCTNCPETDIKARAEAALAQPIGQTSMTMPATTPVKPMSAAPQYQPAAATNRLKELVNTTNGKRHALSDSKMSIGSDPKNQVIVAKDPFVSGVQAILTREDNDMWVEDGIVINPTKLNGKAINGKTKLAHGDAIKLGKTTFRVE